jgi:hypothetical protein
MNFRVHSLTFFALLLFAMIGLGTSRACADGTVNTEINVVYPFTPNRVGVTTNDSTPLWTVAYVQVRPSDDFAKTEMELVDTTVETPPVTWGHSQNRWAQAQGQTTWGWLAGNSDSHVDILPSDLGFDPWGATVFAYFKKDTTSNSDWMVSVSTGVDFYDLETHERYVDAPFKQLLVGVAPSEYYVRWISDNGHTVYTDNLDAVAQLRKFGAEWHYGLQVQDQSGIAASPVICDELFGYRSSIIDPIKWPANAQQHEWATSNGDISNDGKFQDDVSFIVNVNVGTTRAQVMAASPKIYEAITTEGHWMGEFYQQFQIQFDYSPSSAHKVNTYRLQVNFGEDVSRTESYWRP